MLASMLANVSWHVSQHLANMINVKNEFCHFLRNYEKTLRQWSDLIKIRMDVKRFVVILRKVAFFVFHLVSPRRSSRGAAGLLNPFKGVVLRRKNDSNFRGKVRGTS